ncbi:hypothetical protein SISNIDRAFT_460365 [Sistotremastrum niveocremeum HHB9708]|uniref:Uncharacterized protein n=2 Tax=Sistotremastraceae TaxID=3402574 RepID=A0A164NPV4_9AGAM|nr:hypothetical protein SISNIDRAFT_460365 [Sistotremastrum niveocremeum HHB9708]KZT32190.1 hypothetical protein SISSUDRAFT_1055856 [Sistotremastrum suecicum HHB10207 ss-3]
MTDFTSTSTSTSTSLHLHAHLLPLPISLPFKSIPTDRDELLPYAVRAHTRSLSPQWHSTGVCMPIRKWKISESPAILSANVQPLWANIGLHQARFGHDFYTDVLRLESEALHVLRGREWIVRLAGGRASDDGFLPYLQRIDEEGDEEGDNSWCLGEIIRVGDAKMAMSVEL